MADRSVAVRLHAIVTPYQAAMAKATASTRLLQTQMTGVTARSGVMGGALKGAGLSSTLAMGGLALAGFGIVKSLGAAASAAVAFESSFAGIRKTVDATEEEFALLEEGMRDLAKEIPVSVNELNRIGELGGQLGIAKGQLVDFTKVIAGLGVTTDLTVEDAALKLAQFAAVTKMPQDQFENLASTIVALGNNFATTESRIVDFGQRIAGAGAIVGLTEADILGFGAAFSSAGIQAEAGGTAVQKALLSINKSVVTGDENLQTFAETAGMSAQAFARAWQKDPAEAFIAFIEGLGAAGDNAQLILTDLGLTDQRLTRAFLGVAQAGDTMRRANDLANLSFAEGIALITETGERYDTTASKIQLAKNHIEDFKIELGDKLLPLIGDLAEGWAAILGFADKQQDNFESSIALMTQLADSFQDGTISAERYRQGIEGVLSSTDLLTLAQKTALKAFALGLGKKIEDDIPVLEDGASALDQFGLGEEKVEKGADGAAAGIDAIGGAASSAEGEVEDLSDALDQLFGIFIDEQEAAVRLRDSIADMVDAVKESKGAFSLESQAGRDARQAILGAVDAALSHAEALFDQGASVEQVAGALKRHIEDIKGAAAAAGIGEEAISDYIRQLNLTPKQIRSVIELLGADAATEKAERLKDKLNELDGKNVTATLTLREILVRAGEPIPSNLKHAGGHAGSGATRLTGGLRSDEVPTILQRGELVMSRAEVSRGGPSGPTVILHIRADSMTNARKLGAFVADVVEERLEGSRGRNARHERVRSGT